MKRDRRGKAEVMADRAVNKHQIMPIKIDGSLLDPSRPAIALIKMQQLLNLETGKQFAIKILSPVGPGPET